MRTSDGGKYSYVFTSDQINKGHDHDILRLMAFMFILKPDVYE